MTDQTTAAAVSVSGKHRTHVMKCHDPDLSHLLQLGGDIEQNPGPSNKQLHAISTRRSRGIGKRKWSLPCVASAFKKYGNSVEKMTKDQLQNIMTEMGAYSENTKASLRLFIKYNKDKLCEQIQAPDNMQESVQKSNIVLRKTRKAKRFSENWVTVHKKAEIYCLCKKQYKEDGPPMIQCESCYEWYHLPCINIPENVMKTTKDEDITFICGISQCDPRKRCFIVSSQSSVVDLFSPVTIDKISATCNHPPATETTIITDSTVLSEFANATITVKTDAEPNYSVTTEPIPTFNVTTDAEHNSYVITEPIPTFNVTTDAEHNSYVITEPIPTFNVTTDAEHNSYVITEHIPTVNVTTDAEHNSYVITEHIPAVNVTTDAEHNSCVITEPIPTITVTPDTEPEYSVITVPIPTVTGATDVESNSPVISATITTVTGTNDAKVNAMVITEPFIPSITGTNNNNVTTKVSDIVEFDPEERCTTHKSDTDHAYSNVSTVIRESSCTVNTSNMQLDIFKHIPISKETMEICFNHTISEQYFTEPIPATAHFKICNSSWDRMKTLFMNQRCGARCLPRGSWIHIFLDGLKNSNPYCVLLVTRHRISKKVVNSTVSNTTPLFVCCGKCKFTDCTVKFSMRMHDCENVHVTYTGIVKHAITTEHARPISGVLRAQLQQTLSDGPKPYQILLDQTHLTPSSLIIAGNCDKYGVSRSVLQKIGSEGRQLSRRNKEMFTSLLQMSEDFEQETDRKIPGFIHCIMMKPLCIIYWTEVGIRVYHELAKNNTIFWDATGSVVKKYDDQEVLFYELVCRSPEKGKPAIPLTAMLTVRRSVTFVSFWLSNFRSQEQKLYGHSNCVQPRHIMSDRALVFIIAALKEFNNETYQGFLERAWRIITGKCTVTDLALTNPHACLSHIMKSCKKICLDHYRGNFKYGMYCFSALLHSQTLAEATHILKALAHVLLSKYITPEVVDHSLLLNAKINSLPCNDEINHIVSPELVAGDLDEGESDINPNRYTQEDYLSQGHGSSFHKWIDKNISDVKTCISATMTTPNKKYGPVFLARLQKLLFPSIALWSNLLVGDLSRHGSNDPYTTYKKPVSNATSDRYSSGKEPATGNATIEGRFRVLKDIILGGRSSRRIDEFSAELEKNYRETERLVMRSLLKSKPKRKRCSDTKAYTTVCETWKKKVDITNISATPLGTYQKAPPHPFAVPSCTSVDETRAAEGCRAIDLLPKRKHRVQTVTEGNKIVKTIGTPIRNKDIERHAADIQCLHSEGHITGTGHQLSENVTSGGDQLSPTVCHLFSIENINGLCNFELTNCWFNSVLQAFCRTQTFLNCLENMQADLGALERYRPILEVCHDSVTGGGNEVLLHNALHATEKDGFASGQQHCAYEFYNKVITNFMDYSGTHLEQGSTTKCSCGYVSLSNFEKIHEIHLSIPTESEFAGVLTIADLLDIYFEQTSVKDFACNRCKQKGGCVTGFEVSNSSNEVVLHLRRYTFNENQSVTKKHNRSVIIDEKITVGASDYVLHSVVRHHGEGPKSGHYTTLVNIGSIVECNDTRITTSVTLGEAYKDAYIIVYNKQIIRITESMKSLLACISATSTLNEGKDLFETGLTKTVGRLIFCNTLVGAYAFFNYRCLDTLSVLLEMNSCLATECAVSEILELLFCRYLFRYIPAVLPEYFGISIKENTSCDSCGRKLSTHRHCYIGKVNSFDEQEMRNIHHGKQSQEVCQCDGHLSVTDCITNYGATIAIQSSAQSVWNLLNSTNKILLSPSMYLHITLEYEPVSIIASDFSVVVFCKPSLSYRILQSSGEFRVIEKKYLKDALAGDKQFVVFLNRIRKTCHDMYHVTEAGRLSELFVADGRCETYVPEPLVIDREAVIHFTDSFLVEGIMISEEDINRFVGGWLSDHCIEAYFRYLKSKGPARPGVTYHYVHAGWFKSRHTRGMVNAPECSICWFSQTAVLLPINLEDMHWILCIVDINNLTVLYVDSLGKFDQTIAQEVVLYLSFEYGRNHHTSLDTSENLAKEFAVFKAPNRQEKKQPGNCQEKKCQCF